MGRDRKDGMGREGTGRAGKGRAGKGREGERSRDRMTSPKILTGQM
jgi:hypothetical protein